LLGERNYTYAVDVWGIGCIVAELFVGRPILQGGVADAVDESENDLDQYIKICQLCGTPSEATWAGFDELPMSRFAMPKEMYASTINDFLRPRVRRRARATSMLLNRERLWSSVVV
jgi:serine/threonine protein kinase